jgi:hypothetical protein
MEFFAENRHFIQAYRDARTALLAGVRHVLFPLGTYWLSKFADVKCVLQSSCAIQTG